MKRLANVVVYALAALGLFVIIANGVFAVQKHYAIQCVSNEDRDAQENEPFTILTHHPVLYRF